MIEEKNVLGRRDHKVIFKDKNLVIKRFDKNYKKSQILNEAFNMSRVEETSLNVPALVSVKTGEDDLEIAMEYIEGCTLKALMQSDEEHLDRYVNTFVDLQIQIHETNAPILTKMKEKLDHKIKHAPLAATTRMGLRLSLDHHHADLCLCHGDFFPSNVIISKNNTPYIVDWSHASLGSPFADVCNTYLDLWIVFSKDFADKYLAVYLEKTKATREDILSWLSVIIAARLSKNIESEREFLLDLLKSYMA